MLYVFKIIGKKLKYSPKREGASSRLSKDNAAGNFGDTILWPTCWTVRGALSQSILYNRAVSQELRDAVLKEASFRMFFEKFRASKRKLEIDDPKPPKKEKFWVITRKEKLRMCIYSWGALPPNFYLSRNITLKLFRQWKYCF